MSNQSKQIITDSEAKEGSVSMISDSTDSSQSIARTKAKTDINMQNMSEPNAFDAFGVKAIGKYAVILIAVVIVIAILWGILS